MQQDSSEAGPLDQVWRQSPDDYVPLCEAVFWLAIKGGKVPFCPAAWNDAWEKIKGAWCSDKLEVCGRHNGTGFPQPIKGINIAGVDYVSPFGGHRGGAMHPSFPGPHIDFWPHGLHSTDRVRWEAAGFNDTLYVPGQGKGSWTHLMVLKSAVQCLMAFESVTLPEVASTEPLSIEVPPYTLCEKPPNEPQQRIAWEGAKYRWPDERIPKTTISKITNLINLSINEMRRKGKFPADLEGDLRPDGKVNRDAVNRLLGIRRN